MSGARLISIILTTGLLSITVFGCGRSGKVEHAPTPPKPKTTVTQPGKPRQTAEFRIRSSGVRELSWQVGGKYVLRASGEVLTANEATGKASFTKARAELYKGGKRAVLVTAKQIDADTKSGTLTATGGVVARSLVSDAQLSAGQLTWTHKAQRIAGQGGVRVTSDVGSLAADNIEANTEMTDVRLRSNKSGQALLNAAAME